MRELGRQRRRKLAANASVQPRHLRRAQKTKWLREGLLLTLGESRRRGLTTHVACYILHMLSMIQLKIAQFTSFNDGIRPPDDLGFGCRIHSQSDYTTRQPQGPGV
jgi:hypothetical protein